MPKVTIKSLQEQLNTNRELRAHDSAIMQRQMSQIEHLTGERDFLKRQAEDLKREVQWHKQLAQNLSEAICTHMRNR